VRPQEKAAAIYDEAAGMFEGVDDKDVYAVAPLSKVLKEQLSVGKLASSMRTLEKLIKVRGARPVASAAGRAAGCDGIRSSWARRDSRRALYPSIPPAHPPTPPARSCTPA
jgi:hypothetical protein